MFIPSFLELGYLSIVSSSFEELFALARSQSAIGYAPQPASEAGSARLDVESDK